MLCERCKHIRLPHKSLTVDEAGYYEPLRHVCLIRHHRSYEDLIVASEAGCEVCRFFRPFIDHSRLRRTVLETSPSVDTYEGRYRPSAQNDSSQSEQLWITLQHKVEFTKLNKAAVDEMSIVRLSAGSIEAAMDRSCESMCIDGVDGYSIEQVKRLFPTIWEAKLDELGIGPEYEAPEKLPILEFYQWREQTFSALSSVPARGIEEDAASPSVLAIARTWLMQCEQTHQACKLPANLALPARLVDVGSDNSNHPVRLHEVNLSKDSPIRYATLSHCWGANNDAITKLKQANLSNTKKEIELSSLSRNFRDAIIITRGLGLNYIWIDALCIIQDSTEDWAAAVAKMGDYYRRSEVTISALASPAANHGILNIRHSLEAPPKIETEERTRFLRPLLPAAISVVDTDDISEFRRVIATQPISKRAWTLQERLLSRRILHFTEDQLVWQCQYHIVAEDGQYSVERHGTKSHHGKNVVDLINRSLRVVGKEKKRLPPSVRSTGWYELVTKFMARDITYDEDRLPAMAAIAREVHLLTNVTYCAGLWIGDFPTLVSGLLWATDSTMGREGPMRYANNSSPSWSWSSVIAEIYFEIEEEWSIRPKPGLDASLQNWSVELGSQDSFGAVQSGRLVFEAWTQAYYGSKHYREVLLKDAHRHRSHSSSSDGSSDSSESDGIIKLDIIQSITRPIPTDLLVLMLLCYQNEDEGHSMLNAHQYFLVLERQNSNASEPEFRRIGTLQTRDGDLFKIDEEHGWRRHTLAII